MEVRVRVRVGVMTNSDEGRSRSVVRTLWSSTLGPIANLALNGIANNKIDQSTDANLNYIASQWRHDFYGVPTSECLNA